MLISAMSLLPNSAQKSPSGFPYSRVELAFLPPQFLSSCDEEDAMRANHRSYPGYSFAMSGAQWVLEPLYLFSPWGSTLECLDLKATFSMEHSIPVLLTVTTHSASVMNCHFPHYCFWHHQWVTTRFTHLSNQPLNKFPRTGSFFSCLSFHCCGNAGQVRSRHIYLLSWWLLYI